jgi:RNA polymerase sigma-70 factor (TIGR02960 family)
MMPKRATLAQVAAAAGVSVMTASYTYNQPSRVSADARAKVLAAAARLDYPGPDPSARSLRRGSTSTLGVVLGEHLTYAFDDPQAVSFLAGVAEVCAGQGYGMTILPITGDPSDVPRVTDAAVDGFIVWTTSDDDPILAAVRSMNRPAVIHGGPEVPGLDLVTIDNRAAARAIGAVAFAGARRPAIVSQPLSRTRISRISAAADLGEVLFPVTRERLQGFREAAGDAWPGMPVAVCARNDSAEAEQMTAALLASPEPPDAIAAMSDVQAAGVIRAVRASGRTVPGDVAVTGWDDAAVAAELGLTTVAQSLRTQGADCARAVLGQEPPSHRESWSIVRRTTTRRHDDGDRGGFIEAAEPFRRELFAHCYRMLGSIQDAEDVVQETYLRAWRSYGGFEGRSSVRTWLYQIATNRCLTELARPNRRVLPADLGDPEPDPDAPLLTAGADVSWLQPVPDAMVDPASIAVTRDSVRLALVASWQHLPPRQRAVLLLRDVLAFPADDVAVMLGTSTASVKSALHRARGRLNGLALTAGQITEPAAPRARELLDKYIAAFENADAAALERLLVADATLEATPLRTWFAGRGVCIPFLRRHLLGSPGSWRMLATSANGQPAAAAYTRDQDGTYRAYGICVLTVTDAGIRRISSFGDPALVTAFGFGSRLGESFAGRAGSSRV